MTDDRFLSHVNTSNEDVEDNLTTIFMSVRGTKQYWFLCNSKLKCMVKEWGTPTLFLTFSCAEYKSPEILGYLKKVNDVPDNYPSGRLCTEDPISVSHRFSQKFHSFFQTVIVKGQVLGKVTHYFWKKEYQARGVPHYHIVLWIDDAPVLGVDDNSKVIKWIEERITCRIPDQNTNPELYAMVTKYQMHKCSAYCRRKRKVKGLFVTKCKFGFPRPEMEKEEFSTSKSAYKVERKSTLYLGVNWKFV